MAESHPSTFCWRGQVREWDARLHGRYASRILLVWAGTHERIGLIARRRRITMGQALELILGDILEDRE